MGSVNPLLTATLSVLGKITCFFSLSEVSTGPVALAFIVENYNATTGIVILEFKDNGASHSHPNMTIEALSQLVIKSVIYFLKNI